MQNKILSIFFFFAVLIPAATQADDIALLVNTDKVTMVNFGSEKCLPCRMMTPVINKLKKEYAGKASILYIDIYENRNIARKYGISTVPTQIFYDKQGLEVFRHIGFFDHENSWAQLEKLGVR
ncbi:MAG: thioredoxin family protein [Proteobacteria bacterium]|nr:thioredoxin family protein [Pseudomonadota bacterium]MBU1711142.1 thioredoxin family protein [Pseudomonadota bacterium]